MAHHSVLVDISEASRAASQPTHGLIDSYSLRRRKSFYMKLQWLVWDNEAAHGVRELCETTWAFARRLSDEVKLLEFLFFFFSSNLNPFIYSSPILSPRVLALSAQYRDILFQPGTKTMTPNEIWNFGLHCVKAKTIKRSSKNLKISWKS